MYDCFKWSFISSISSSMLASCVLLHACLCFIILGWLSENSAISNFGDEAVEGFWISNGSAKEYNLDFNWTCNIDTSLQISAMALIGLAIWTYTVKYTMVGSLLYSRRYLQSIILCFAVGLSVFVVATSGCWAISKRKQMLLLLVGISSYNSYIA